MFEHILVPLVGSSLTECALPCAVAKAQAYSARVTLTRVPGPTRPIRAARSASLLGWHFDEIEAVAYLDGWGARLREVGLCAERTLLEGPAMEYQEY
jgi:nucleotide-binding universal stress UspA family protein